MLANYLWISDVLTSAVLRVRISQPPSHPSLSSSVAWGWDIVDGFTLLRASRWVLPLWDIRDRRGDCFLQSACSSCQHCPHKTSSFLKRRFVPIAPDSSFQNFHTPAQTTGKCPPLKSLNPSSNGGLFQAPDILHVPVCPLTSQPELLPAVLSHIAHYSHLRSPPSVFSYSKQTLTETEPVHRPQAALWLPPTTFLIGADSSLGLPREDDG